MFASKKFAQGLDAWSEFWRSCIEKSRKLRPRRMARREGVRRDWDERRRDLGDVEDLTRKFVPRHPWPFVYEMIDTWRRSVFEQAECCLGDVLGVGGATDSSFMILSVGCSLASRSMSRMKLSLEPSVAPGCPKVWRGAECTKFPRLVRPFA